MAPVRPSPGLAGVGNSTTVPGILSPLPSIAETAAKYSGPVFKCNYESAAISDLTEEGYFSCVDDSAPNWNAEDPMANIM